MSKKYQPVETIISEEITISVDTPLSLVQIKQISDAVGEAYKKGYIDAEVRGWEEAAGADI